MKKIFTIAISAILMLLSALSVSAATETYFIDELGISVNIPSGYIAVTRDTEYDATELEKFGYTKEDLVKTFEEEDVYLVAFPKLYGTEQMILSSTDIDIRSLSDFTEYELKAFAEDDLDKYEAEGYVVSDYEIFESHNATYIATSFSAPNGDYAIHYWTIENYKVFNISCWCYWSEPTVNQKQIFLSFINGITFNTDTSATETEDNNIQFYENTVIFELANEGKLTTIGIAAIVTVVLTLIAGGVVAIILITKAKKRRRAALEAQKAINADEAANTKYCINCGTQISADDTFCFNCGKSQATSVETENTENNE